VGLFLFLILFVALPLFELYLLIQVGSEIGALPTLALSVLTALVGSLLVRMQGFGVLQRVRAAAERGELPALELIDGVLLLGAGFALLLPGFLTDLVGFLLLASPLRRAVIARFLRIVPEAGAGVRYPHRGSGSRVIEGEFHREDR
jgi:UPF0716 protein FxsA